MYFEGFTKSGCRSGHVRTRHGWRYLFYAVILQFFVVGAWAQLATTTATLSGTVTDSSGSVVAGATATLSSTENGVTQTDSTNSEGYYSFSQLPPGTYKLTVQWTGFKTYQQNGIVLNSAQSALQNVKLEVGASSQEVTVNAEASNLNVSNANIATELSGKEVVELPLNMRNIYDLVTLNSSVQNNSENQALLGGGSGDTNMADQDAAFFNFAGGFFGTTAFLLDGVWDTEPTWGGVIVTPSVDSVSEFKVQNNSFTAQYGWSTGNVINVTTKSGTSTFHGDAWEFYRNDAMDANLWFNNYYDLPKAAYSRNQYGVVAGGPLYIPKLYKQREKTFIFGTYEHAGLSTPARETFTVPDAAYLAGNFSALLGAQEGTDALGRPIYAGQIYNPQSTRAITAGTVDPVTGLMANSTGYIRDPIAGNNVAGLGAFNAIGAKLASYYPSPNEPGLVNNLAASATAPAEDNEYSVRVDENLTDASRFYARFEYKSEWATQIPEYWGASDPAGPGNLRPDNRWSIAGGYTHIFSPTLTMTAVAGYEYWSQVSTNQSKGFQPSTLGLPSQLDAWNPEFPIVTVGSQTTLGPTGGLENASIPPTMSVSDDFIKQVGKHTFSFGAMFVNGEFDLFWLCPGRSELNGAHARSEPGTSIPADTGNGGALRKC